MQDENDILFNEYSIDFFAIGKAFFAAFSDSPTETVETGPTFFEILLSWTEVFWNSFSILAWILSALFIYGIIYAYIRDGQLSEIEDEGIATDERLYAELYKTQSTNKRWDHVLVHVGTDNPDDWKLAIIEADIMLEAVLDSAGYAGKTIGEKLKSASPTVVKTLDHAWKAHMIRNKIAHQGIDFVLTKKLAQETITQYRMVFEEFKVV